MKRSAMQELFEWKNKKNRKPLVIKGARQVGKTWLMKEFGRNYYEKFFYFNFDEEEELKSIFKTTKSAERIIQMLGVICEDKIEPEKHLIIFDEIQESPEALNSLKYFYENTPEYHVVTAGSLLGTLLAQPKSYPVGKVNLLNLDPLSFEEFLWETKPALAEYMVSIKKGDEIPIILHQQLLEQYRYYLIIGGMPECVMTWVETGDSGEVAKIQDELISLYENDFSKHNGKVNAGRILLVFRSIVTQLSKENGKFVYGCIKKGARAREFEEAIEWLVSTGLLIRIYNVEKNEHPLKVYEILNHFKLYFFDVGLLKRMAGISNEAILLQKPFQFSGPLAENFCLQQMNHQLEYKPHYYAPSSTSEIDMLLEKGMGIIPVEIKAGNSIHANAFSKYIKNENPKLAIRFSQKNLQQNEVILNLPLYLAGKVKNFI